MTLEDIIDTYGYAAIVVGTFFEGETVLVLGGTAAKLGYLELPWVILCAFFGTYVGDQFFFFLGRYKGQVILEKWPSWQKRVDRVLLLMEKRRMVIILGFRFIYGIRSVTPFVLGMTRVPVAEFMVLNGISAVAWANLFGILGYIFGKGLELLLGDIKDYELGVLAGILIMGIVLWVIKVVRRRRQ